MHILGIDPGTGRTGWGIINNFNSEISPLKIENNGNFEYVDHGCIQTSQDDTMPKRLLSLHNQLSEIIKNYKPQSVIIERIFFGRNTKTAISVGQARGVIMLAAGIYNLPTFEYTSISVKHFLSGYGRTEKKDIQIIVRKLLKSNKRRLPFSTKDKGFDDAADALAIAIFHILKYPTVV